MKILYLCHRFPFPPKRGGKIRPFNMIHHFAREHRDFCALFAECQRDIVPDSARRASHQHRLVEEISAYWSLGCFLRFAHVDFLVASLMTVTSISAASFRSCGHLKRGMFDGAALSCALCAGTMQTATAMGAILLGNYDVINFDTGVPASRG